MRPVSHSKILRRFSHAMLSLAVYIALYSHRSHRPVCKDFSTQGKAGSVQSKLPRPYPDRPSRQTPNRSAACIKIRLRLSCPTQNAYALPGSDKYILQIHLSFFSDFRLTSADIFIQMCYNREAFCVLSLIGMQSIEFIYGGKRFERFFWRSFKKGLCI